MGISTNVLQLVVAGTDTLDALAAATGKAKKSIVKAAQVLKGMGFLSVCDKLDEEMGTLARGMYIATPAGEAFVATGAAIKPGLAGPRPRKKTVGLRERAWWHFRAHKLTTLRELLSTHAEGTEKAASNNLYKYIAALEAAGIVKRLANKQPAKQSKGRVQWLLEKDLGLQAPVWRQKAQEVYDPNGDTVYSIKKAGE